MKAMFKGGIVVILFLVSQSINAQSYYRGSKNYQFSFSTLQKTYSPSIKRDTMFSVEHGVLLGIGKRYFDRMDVGLRYGISTYNSSMDQAEHPSQRILHFAQLPILFNFDFFQSKGWKSMKGACRYLDIGMILGGDVSYSFLQKADLNRSLVEAGFQTGLKFKTATSGSRKKLMMWDKELTIMYRHGLSPMAAIADQKTFSNYLSVGLVFTHYKTYFWSLM